MRLSRIQLSRVSASLFMLSLMGSISLLPSRLAAQTCTGTLQSSTQTVSLTGTGGNEFTPSFTQYNPPAGYALVSAGLQTTIVSLGGTILLTNSQSSSESDLVGLADDDQIDVNGTTIGSVETPYTYYPFASLPANSMQTLGPAPLVTNGQLQYDSLTNASPVLNSFIGTGSVDMFYFNYIFTQFTNGNVSLSEDLSVNINFRLTYYYCYTGTLAVNLLNFTATLENPQTVLLNWLTTDEMPGEKYVVQVSSGNGTDFLNVDTVSADGVAGNGNYAYQYMVPPADKGNLYFRIQLIDANGTVSYSPLRVINLGNGAITAFSIYPNPPSTFINLAFPGNSQNWEVQIFAANGNLVQQNYFSNTNLATVNFNNKMAAGAYFVRAINPQTNDHYAGSFLIRD